VATLSLIDTTHAEIRYNGRDTDLSAASWAQTVTAMAAVYGVPAGPWNPGLVDIALSALGVPFLRARSCWPDDGSFVIYPTAPAVGSSRVDLQACKLEYSIVSPK